MEPLDAKDPAFVGPYRLIARLGEGGMGRVYLGMSAGRRVVAVKVIHADHARDREFRERFKIEVAAAKRVQAAFTAPVIDAGEDDDPPWLVTSLVAGPSLAEVIRSQGPLPSEPVWRLVAGLAEALAAVHACGIVHRDVTPGNVLLAIDGPRLIDFGLARALGSSNMTATGIVIGTPAFLSPEHVRGEQVGPASDIFSLGSLLVFAATGAAPFGSGEPIEVLGRILAGEPDFRGLGGRLLEVAGACLAREPADRPAPAEIIQSVPSDSALLAGGPATQFWPGQLGAFIRSYQASFDVVVPGPSNPTLPFKPPKEIAAEAVSLAQSGRQDDAHHLLATAATFRPDQEVAALIALLRAEGRHTDAEVVINAAVRRPAREVASLAGMLRQIGSSTDADTLLDQAVDGSAESVGAIVAALAAAGETDPMRRLLRAVASTAPRQPQAIVTLVGVLSSAGLDQDITRLMDMVTALVSPAQAAVLGDAMRVSGHREAAVRLYSAAVDVVALRPAAEIASVLRVIRDAEQGDLADRLTDAVTRARLESADVVQLAAALSHASLENDWRTVLAAAANSTPIAEVIEIAESLLAMNHQEAALSICAEAAASDPSATGALVDALRDIGRPVDAYRLLQSLGNRTAGHAAEVIAGLRAAGRDDDADRVLRAFLSQGPDPVCDLLARLGQLGASEDGARIARLVDPRTPGPLSELASSLIARQMLAVADHLLARAAQDSALCCCELIDRAARPQSTEPRSPAKGSNFPAPHHVTAFGRRPQQEVKRGAGPGLFPLHWQAHHDHGGLLSCLRRLRNEHLGIAAHEMLSYAAQMPITDAVRFARELDWVDEPGSTQTRPFGPGTSEAAAMVATTTGRTDSEVGAVLQALLDRPHATPGRRRLAANQLLSVMMAYPSDVVAAVAMGVNATPDLLPIFVRVAKDILPEIMRGSYVDRWRFSDSHAELLKAAGANLSAADFCHLYLDLKERMDSDEASFLLTGAAMNPEAPEIIKNMKSYGLRREARQLDIAARRKDG